ncbi:MAG: DUF4279 domain-containing protein [Oscillochloris sp.]|nr:DUF4279 domain-containing protein [Oscillochloris sp.]
MEYRLGYTEQPTAIVYLSLKGEDLVPEEISDALGVLPDKAWKKGDVKKPRRPVAKDINLPVYTFGHWALNAPCSQHDEAEHQLEQLLTRLEELPGILKKYIETFDSAIVVGYSTGEVIIGFYLPVSILRRLSSLGLAIVFDIYPVSRSTGDDEEMK